jgi:WD40 repeat protein
VTVREFPGHAPDDPVAVRKRKAARWGARACGLALAAIIAGVLYGGLLSSSAPPRAHATPSASVKDTSIKDISLGRLGTFSLAGFLSSVQFSPDGQFLVATAGTNVSPDSQIVLWSTSTAQPVTSFPALADGVPPGDASYESPVFSSDGKSLAAIDVNNNNDGGSEIMDLWNVATGQGASAPVPIGPASEESPPALVVPGPDNLLAGVNDDGTAEVLNIASGQYVGTLSDTGSASEGPALQFLTFSPDGKTIAATDGAEKIYLWGVPSARSLATLTAENQYNNSWNPADPNTSNIDSLTFSPDSTVVACGTYAGIVRVWDVATGRSISAFSVDGDDPSGAVARPVTTLVFSPDGHMLVTADSTDGTLGVWDVASGRDLATLSVPGGDVASAAFTPAGTLLVATTNNNNPADDRIEIWTTGKSLAALLHSS